MNYLLKHIGNMKREKHQTNDVLKAIEIRNKYMDKIQNLFKHYDF